MNRSSDTAAGTDRPCGLTALLPLGMSCRGRAEAFARRLQSRLRTLGSNGIDDSNGVANESTENTWLTSPETANVSSVTNHQPLATLSQEVADSYFDFDLPGSPTDDSECTRLLEVPSPTPHDMASESGYVCASPLSSPETSEAVNHSRSSSDEPYYDVDNSDVDQRSNDFYDCDDTSRKENASEVFTTMERSISKADRLRVSHNIFHSLDSDSCSESLPKSQSTSGSTCTALSSASIQTLHDNTDETDFCSLRDDVGQPQMNGNCIPVVQQNGHKETVIDEAIDIDDDDEENLPEYKDLESKLNAFKPIYRKVSRQERKEDTEINDDAKLINNIVVHEGTPESPIAEENDDDNDDQTLLSNQNGLSPHEEEEELTRPQRIRRCSSLKSGKTPPGTPGRKKIVRFADMLGLDLADVRTFMDEVPRIPKCAYEDLEVSFSHIAQISLGPRVEKILMPMFQQPGARPNFLDVVQQYNVALENAAVTDPICLTITGSVRVRNLDFHKSVHLRYSTNGWCSYADMQATYVENSCDGFSDKFTFIIFGNSLQVGERIEIAVRFSCKGQQFWDNNFGANYCFQCLPSTTPATRVVNHNSNENPLSISPDDVWSGGSSFY